MTAVVSARYEIKSDRRIALTFEEAGVGDVKISKELESFLAPAILPRSWLTHRLLLAVKEVRLDNFGKSLTVEQNLAEREIEEEVEVGWGMGLHHFSMETGIRRWSVR